MTTESLATGNTTDTGAASTAATTAETSTPAVETPAVAAATEQQTPETKPTDAPADKAADGTDPVKPDDKPTAPEKYEFKTPEGTELNPEVMGQFEGVAKELGLSQEAAQKVIDAMSPKIAAVQAAQIEAIKTQWTESSKTDKEFGGDKLNENLAVAKKAMDAFGTPELRTLLNETGLGNHPEIIRAFYRAGQKISSGNFVPGGGGATVAKDTASALYPNQK